jgi:hypothetical protein
MTVKARLQMVGVIVAALLLAMLLGIMVTRASASGPVWHTDPNVGFFACGILVGALGLASVICIAVGIRHLLKKEASNADSA